MVVDNTVHLAADNDDTTVASLVVLYASTLLMVWISAKIYRVGIFMYGKKPSFKELIRWARYK
jgi:ABC-2 type transport system permease protein